MPVNPRFGPARGVWRRLRGLGRLLRWRGGFRILARCARPVILSARMPGAEENVAWTALGEEHGDGCWTRVRFPPSPPFKGRGELTGGAYLRVSRAPDARPATPFRYRTRFMVSRFIVHRAFPVAFHHRLWYHLPCEASTARAGNCMEGTREWLSARIRSLT